MLDLISIGNRIHEYRTKLDVSQEELANMLYVTRQAVSRWEQGQILPSVDNICQLVAIFHISVEQLLLNYDDTLELTATNMFDGAHSRQYVVSCLIDGKLDVDLADCLYAFSPEERLILLASVKSCAYLGKVNHTNLWVRLTPEEKQYLDLNKYKEELKCITYGIVCRKKKGLYLHFKQDD